MVRKRNHLCRAARAVFFREGASDYDVFVQTTRSVYRRIVIAVHLVFHGYGFWLPNDLRGSGSTEVRKDELRELGDPHFGRKPDRDQPSRDELKEFSQHAEPMLEHELLWFNSKHRQAIGKTFAKVVAQRRYTVYACAILQNHAHACVRTHRDRAEDMWHAFAEASQKSLRAFAEVPTNHSIWSHRPYKVFLYTPDEVITRIDYINGNPKKHHLPPQSWPFISPFK